VPVGYISGASLAGTSTYLNASFASLGLTPGEYTWTWGSGDHADSFTLDVGGVIPPTVPEPSTWAMMLLGFAGLGYAAVRRRVKSVDRRRAPSGEMGAICK
jgi:PEP-CTERM motif-containing protein